MPSPYRRGYEAERKAKKELEAQGYTVIRAAGSRGPFDLVAIGNGEIHLIQVKRAKTNNEAYDGAFRCMLLRLSEELGNLAGPKCAFVEVWFWIDRTGWFKRIINTKDPAQECADGL